SMRCARLGDTGRGSRSGPRNAPLAGRKYDATIKDAVTALWEASDRVCSKRLVVMIPTLAPALERHGRLKLDAGHRERVLAISAATIDRMLGPTKLVVAGGRRRRMGFYSAIRREVPIRTFNLETAVWFWREGENRAFSR